MEDIIDDLKPLAKKKRHIAVTIWLVIILISNSLWFFSYIFMLTEYSEDFTNTDSILIFILLTAISIADVVFSFLILKWKKIGFWGFGLSCIGIIIINLTNGTGIIESFVGLVGLSILYLVLQIKAGNVSAWNNLE